MTITLCTQKSCPFMAECKRAEYHYDSLENQYYWEFKPEVDAFGVATCDYFIHKDQIRMFDESI